MSQKFATDYIDVATRLVEFREKYPEGSLQPAVIDKPYSIEEIGGQTYIVVVAAAYRTAEDSRPGIGMAYELFPGKTPYTRGSELQNAETSAWGRAIVAALAADTKKGIASAEEVRNRQAEREVPPSPADAARTRLLTLLKGRNISPKDAAAKFAEDGHGNLGQSTDVEAINALHAFYERGK
ncbi:hypothetical protein [Rhodococcus sp. 5G237]